MGKEIKELKTFEEQMDFLAADEQEAIDGYDEIIALVEDEHVKEQLNKIKTEEIAHKEFLEKVKEDHSLEYTEPLEQEEPEKMENLKEELKVGDSYPCWSYTIEIGEGEEGELLYNVLKDGREVYSSDDRKQAEHWCYLWREGAKRPGFEENLKEGKEGKKISYGIVYILHDDNDERGEMFDTEEEAKEFAKSIDKEKYNGYRIMKIESHEEDGEEIFDDEIVVDSEAFDKVEESLTENKYKNVKLTSVFDEKIYTFDEAVDVYCGELLDTAVEPLISDDEERDALYDKIEACKTYEEKWNLMRPYAVELVINDIENYMPDYSTFKLIEEESLTEAEEDELSDDELDALDAEEEKAFKQKQADRRARVAGKRKEKEDKLARVEEVKKALGSNYDFDKLFDVLVPPSGKADTVAGEVVRALNKVDYRDFNDGEVFYESDGLDTCGGAMAFVAEFFLDKFNDSDDTDTTAQAIYDKIIDIAESQLRDAEYTGAISELEKMAVEWIKGHEETLVEPNEKDCLHEFDGEEYFADYIPSYDIEDIELPMNVKELLELGVIDGDDIIWAVQDIIQGMGNSTDDVDYEGDYISVHGLSKADFDACGGEQGADLYDWIEQWAQNEYDDPDEIRARQEEEERAQYADAEEEEESEEETDEGLTEGDTGYDHYGPKDMEPFKGPAYIQYDGGPRQIDVLTRAGNHKWVWKNIAGCSDSEWYIFPTYEDALAVQKKVGGEILSWNEYAGIKDDEPEEEEESLKEESAGEYAVIKTNDWYDPEGLNIPSKAEVLFTGDAKSCYDFFFNKREELENKYKGDRDIKVSGIQERRELDHLEKAPGGGYKQIWKEGPGIQYFEVYFMNAISKDYYSVVKNIDNSKSEAYNELHEDEEMNLWKKLEPLYNEGNVYFDVVEKQNGGDFIIFEDWKSLIAVEKALQPGFEPKDEYDTSVLDELDIDYGFSDEWGRCDTCGKLIRLEADSAHWVPDYYWDENGIECGNCVRQHPEGYISWLLEDPANRANTILDGKALESAGFHKVDGNYENGWYDRHDSPEEILAKAQEEHPEAEFIFSISGVGKFAVQFELWMRGE